jgi:hypothetical protein
MPIIFDYECPYCGTEMHGSFGDNVFCAPCNLSFETDQDGNDESFDGWLTGIEHKGRINIPDEL